ncbi:hypothetical protein Mapa_011419 [Marchantia paleacea]|nr:hypothetical protein Mapa_011419 [Marchantia paleacea]
MVWNVDHFVGVSSCRWCIDITVHRLRTQHLWLAWLASTPSTMTVICTTAMNTQFRGLGVSEVAIRQNSCACSHRSGCKTSKNEGTPRNSYRRILCSRPHQNS